MRHFQLVAAGVDVLPMLHAIQQQPDLWNRYRLRKDYPDSPHAEMDDIWLWFNRIGGDLDVANDMETVPYPGWQALPQARPVVFDLMRRVEGVRLGRVLVTRLAPGKRIAAHEDAGAPATYYQRYQVALQSLPGCRFRIGHEVRHFNPGEVWWIDNETEHEVANNSADDRIVMIVDIRTAPC